MRFLTKTHQFLTEVDTFIIIQRVAFFMRNMVDLFSGLGGASEAFVQAGWRVHRFDNNRLFSDPESEYFVPRTIWADLELMRMDFDEPIEFLWASPPCYEFSNAHSAPRGIAGREGRLDEYKPDMTLLRATIKQIEELKPKYWCIENVIGSIRYFEPYLGKPKVIAGPYVLWGNFPPIVCQVPKDYSKRIAGDKHRHSPIRSNHRAKVPMWLSQQMLDGITYQKQLTEWI